MANFPLGNTIDVDNTKVETTGSFTASAQSVSATVDESSMVSVFLFGTYNGLNLTFEVSSDNTNWVAVQAYRTDTGAVSTTTGVITNSIIAYHIACQGMRYLRARSTAWVSGTLSIKIRSIAIGSPNIVTLGATPSVTADTELPAAAAISDVLANPTTPQIAADHMMFNGTQWERYRSNQNVVADSSAARTSSGNGTAVVNYNWRGMHFCIKVTAASGTPSMTVRLQRSDDGGTTWVDWDTTNLQTAAITGTGTYWLSVYPGIATAANASRNDILPRNFRAAWTISGGTPSLTFITTAQFVL